MKRAYQILAGVCAALFAGILAIIVFHYADTSFACKRTFLMPQGAMLLSGSLVLGLLCLISTCRCEKRIREGYGLSSLIPWGALLAVQLVLCFHAYFLTGWDVKGIIESAYALAGGEASMHASYLSMYPNNIPLVLIWAAVMKLLRLVLGNPGLDRCVYVLIACQCVLNTATGMLGYRVVRKATGSNRLAWCASLVYMGFVGLSPWLLIPYSDSMVLIFPTLILALYQRYGEKRWSWPMIGLCTAAGYMIKPQAAIVTIAVVMIETIRMAGQGKLLEWGKRAASALAVMAVLLGPCQNMAAKIIPGIDTDRNMGILHFAMMGLNTKTNGVYDYDDVVLSASAQAQERSEVQIEEIKRRLSAMDAGDMLEHLKKKTLTNYADGSFAWGMEGEFYREWIEDKDDVLSPFLKRIIHVDSDQFKILLTAQHAVWLALLLGCMLCGGYCCAHADKTDHALLAMMLSLVGLTLFEWIFEARARYLYLYAPFYVMLGTYGFWQTTAWIKKLKRT